MGSGRWKCVGKNGVEAFAVALRLAGPFGRTLTLLGPCALGQLSKIGGQNSICASRRQSQGILLIRSRVNAPYSLLQSLDHLTGQLLKD